MIFHFFVVLAGKKETAKEKLEVMDQVFGLEYFGAMGFTSPTQEWGFVRETVTKKD